MTELRKRMIECLQLRGLSERTHEAYVRAVFWLTSAATPIMWLSRIIDSCR